MSSGFLCLYTNLVLTITTALCLVAFKKQRHVITITTSNSELLSNLVAVSKIIPAKHTLPILSCFLFTIDNGELYVTGAGHIGQIRTHIPNASTSGPISICLESKILVDALKTLPEQPITFEIQDNLATTIKYKGGRFEMVGKESKEFPKPKEVNNPVELSIPLDIFLTGISKTIICSADDELRPIMNSVLIEIEAGQINHVTSDGHTLALLEHKDESFESKQSFVLPKEIAFILNNILPQKSSDAIEIKIGNTNVCFEFDSITVTAQLQEGRFPNYRSVIPSANDKVLTIETGALKSAISRVLVFTSQISKRIKFEISNNQLLVSGQDTEFSTCADEKIECEYSGQAFEIGFNGTLLHQLIKTIPSAELTISFSDPKRAALIYPSDNSEQNKLTYLIMPLMLG